MTLLRLCDVGETEIEDGEYITVQVPGALLGESDPVDLDVCSPECLANLAAHLIEGNAPDNNPDALIPQTNDVPLDPQRLVADVVQRS